MTERLEKKSYTYRTTVIAYYVSGASAGHKKETLVMLHAAFADHRIFTPQVEALSQTYQVIRVDLVGHGGSQPSKLGVSMKDMPQVVVGILDQENVTTAHIIGVSLGSLVAQSIAHRYPDRVRSADISTRTLSTSTAFMTLVNALAGAVGAEGAGVSWLTP